MARPVGSYCYSPITINTAKVGATLTNYAASYDLSLLPSRWWKNVSAAGDIVVYEPAGDVIKPRYLSPDFSIANRTGVIYFDTPVSTSSAKIPELHVVPGYGATNSALTFTNSSALNAMSMAQASDGETDMAGNWNSTAYNVTSYQQAGQMGKCTYAGSANCGFSLSGTPYSFFNGATSFTISWLIKPTNLSSQQDMLLYIYGSTWMRLQLNVAANTIMFQLYKSPDQPRGENASLSTYMSNNNWYNIVLVYNGAGSTNSDKVKIYINNVSLSLSFPAGDFPTAIYDYGTSMSFSWFRTGSYSMPGYIDDCQIYSDAKDANWVTTKYNNYFDSGFYTLGTFVETHSDVRPLVNIAAMGQSNMVGQDTTHGYSSPAFGSLKYVSAKYWRSFTVDPITTGATLWPNAVTAIRASYPKTVLGIIPTAVGGTGVYDTWSVNTSTTYKNAVLAIKNSGGADIAVFYGGENDIGSAITKANFKTAWNTMMTNFATDLGYNLTYYCIVPYVGTSSAAANNAIRDGFDELATESAYVKILAYASDYQDLIDTLHLSKSAMDNLGSYIGGKLCSLYNFAQGSQTWDSSNVVSAIFPYKMVNKADQTTGLFPAYPEGSAITYDLKNGAQYVAATKGITFDASNDYILTNYAIPFTSSYKFTVEFWYDVKDISSGGKCFFSQYDDANNAINVYRSFATMYCIITVGGTQKIIQRDNLFLAGLHHYVVRFNYTSVGEFDIFCDSCNGVYTKQDAYTMGTKTFTGKIGINAYQNGASQRNDDTLYSWIMYSDAISNYRIASNYAAGLDFFGNKYVDLGNGYAKIQSLTKFGAYNRPSYNRGSFNRGSFR